MRNKYDYLVVGSGLFGSTFAQQATEKGKKCLALEKRNHIGGNVYTEEIEGVKVHKYCAHIFHTNNSVVAASIQMNCCNLYGVTKKNRCKP